MVGRDIKDEKQLFKIEYIMISSREAFLWVSTKLI